MDKLLRRVKSLSIPPGDNHPSTDVKIKTTKRKKFKYLGLIHNTEDISNEVTIRLDWCRQIQW